MSPWFIRKGTFSQPLSWRGVCMSPLIGWPGLSVRLLGGDGGGEDFCISMGTNLLGLLCTVRGPPQAYTGGLYFGALALFNTITTPPFCPDLLALFICISRSLGCKVSSCKPFWMGNLIWGVVLATEQGVCPQHRNVDLRKQHREDG